MEHSTGCSPIQDSLFKLGHSVIVISSTFQHSSSQQKTKKKVKKKEKLPIFTIFFVFVMETPRGMKEDEVI